MSAEFLKLGLRDLRGPNLPWLLTGLALAAAVLAAVMASMIAEEAVIAFSDQPADEIEIGQSARRVSADSPLPPVAPTNTGAVGGPPLLSLPSLLEQTSDGRLPRIGEDGVVPWRAYRRVPEPAQGPKIALLIHEIGLAAEPSAAAGMLPFVVSLATSPYAADGPGWQHWVRAYGHESLLEVPVASMRPMLGDGGPDALRPNEPPSVLVDKLQRILARGRGYPAVIVQPAELGPTVFGPLAAELGRRGVGFIELGSRKLGEVARDAKLPYLSSSGPIDTDPSAGAIDAALGALEARALSEGQAIGHGRPLRTTIERIAAWSQTLPQKGIYLVSPGALLGD